MQAETPEIKNRAMGCAERYLIAKGYQVLAKEWACYAGQADIIAAKDGKVTFFEVLASDTPSLGFPEAEMTAEKRKRLEIIVATYLSCAEFAQEMDLEFGVISMILTSPTQAFVRVSQYKKAA